MLVRADRTVIAEGTLDGTATPDLGVVDCVARLMLLATRLGGHVVLRDVQPAVRELIELAGLPVEMIGPVEMEGQAELGEQALRVEHVEKVIRPGDLPA